jgi:phospholipase/carboxylesterase
VTAAVTTWVDSGNLGTASESNPLIVLLHGYGSNERDLPGLVSWLGTHNPWVSLRAPFALEHGGFAWFPITTPLNPSASDLDTATTAVWGWIDQHVDPLTPLIVIGFSQGGMMTTQLLRTRPERIVRAAVLAGFATAIPQIGDEALAARRPAVLWTRGTADTIITDDANDRTRTVLSQLCDLNERTYPGLGHSVDERVLADVRDYLA